MSETVRHVQVLRGDRDGMTREADRVVVEAPLEVRIQGEPFAVIMRTPGQDPDLAVGFLFSEGVIRGDDDIRSTEVVDDDVINIKLSMSRAEILPELLAGRRNVTATSSCGVCGRSSLAALETRAPKLTASWTVSPITIGRLPNLLQAAQHAFAETGGLHAAALFDRDGTLRSSAEDVGRHNAVDKLVGRMLREKRLPLDDLLLFVSGRSSYEIVQKAICAGIPIVAAVSAPSSLAVDLARDSGMTLLGFVREGRFNVYCHEYRLETQSFAR